MASGKPIQKTGGKRQPTNGPGDRAGGFGLKDDQSTLTKVGQPKTSATSGKR
jgi:hypothetical protein